eukprot:374184-Pleurochrysis_carterae.AAC.2
MQAAACTHTGSAVLLLVIFSIENDGRLAMRGAGASKSSACFVSFPQQTQSKNMRRVACRMQYEERMHLAATMYPAFGLSHRMIQVGFVLILNSKLPMEHGAGHS